MIYMQSYKYNYVYHNLRNFRVKKFRVKKAERKFKILHTKKRSLQGLKMSVFMHIVTLKNAVS